MHDRRWCDGAVGCQYTWDLLGGKATAASYSSSSSNFCLASKEGSKKGFSQSHGAHWQGNKWNSAEFFIAAAVLK